jgi:hypothetical protein
MYMKVDMEKEIRKYLEKHPKRTVIVDIGAIESGGDDDFLTYEPGIINYTVVMEDGTKRKVSPGEMFPE